MRFARDVLYTRRGRGKYTEQASHEHVPMEDLPDRFAEMPERTLAGSWVAMLVDAIWFDGGKADAGGLARALVVVSTRLHGTHYDMEALMPAGFTKRNQSDERPQAKRKSRGSSCPLRAAMEELAPGEWLDVDPKIWKRPAVTSRLTVLHKAGKAKDVRSYLAAGGDGRIVVFREPAADSKARKKV